MNIRLTNFVHRGDSAGLDGRRDAPSIPAPRRQRAFTLMEVMTTIGVFCIGVFAILDLVANVMHGARLLDRPMVDAGCVVSEVAQTNSLVEVTDVNGDLSDFLGKPYQGYTYTYDVTEALSNKLFAVDVVLQSPASGHPVISKMTVLLYRPLSPAGSLDGATVGR
jgi:prepilin-type N-terminal cleavage/methylation domain-containing protein